MYEAPLPQHQELVLSFSILDCDSSINCSSHGSCASDGSCSCSAGYKGTHCDSCDSSYYNYPSCVCMLSSIIWTGLIFSSRLLDLFKLLKSWSLLFRGWIMPMLCRIYWNALWRLCSGLLRISQLLLYVLLVPARRYNLPFCLLDCTSTANCSHHGTCLADSTCQCDSGFTSSNCAHCAADYYGYPTCACTFSIPGLVLILLISIADCTSATNCSTHGSCSITDGSCECSTGYTGTHCDGCATDYYAYPNCVCMLLPWLYYIFVSCRFVVWTHCCY